MKNNKRGADLLAQCLVKHKVNYIFAIPGAKIDPLFDALLDTSIKVIVCRHEQNAAFMAAAYGRLTGKPGIVIVTSGPGVANLATGLLTATTEGDPVIAIGGNVARCMKLKETHQNTDNIKLMSAVTKCSMEVIMPENIPEVIENAFRKAVAPRAGAIFISLPQDTQTDLTTAIAYEPIAPVQLGTAPVYVIEQAAKMIRDASVPVILLGQEASRAENTAAIRQLLAHFPLATVSTYQAAGVISRELVQHFFGRVGLFKNQPGDRLLDSADLVITIGYNPVEYDPEIWHHHQRSQLIHIDYNPTDIHTDYLPNLEIIGDIASNIKQLFMQFKQQQPLDYQAAMKPLQDDLTAKIQSGKLYPGPLMHPLRFIHDLTTLIDDQTMVISDIGSHYMWLARYLFCYQPHHLLFSNGQQTLGVALPWAMAAKFVYPDKKVISISGDGGFLFSAMELETAVREQLSFVHCIWCDGTYNMVQEQQLIKYQRDSAVHFGAIDHVKFAQSFGAHGFRVHEIDEFKQMLATALTLKGPVLIEVAIDYRDNQELFLSSHEQLGH
jgi:acetolactate synthase I/II/III large subunit